MEHILEVQDTAQGERQENVQPSRLVQLVGVGPGNPEYVTASVAGIIASAEVVAGFATVLGVVEHLIKGQRLVLTYRNQEAQLAELALAHAEGKRCVVCCYGDVNFSAQELIARVEGHCGPTERMSGISSVQVACAKAALAMEETFFVTLHARDGIEAAQQEIVEMARAGKRNLIILPLPWSFMPAQIAQMLMQGGVAGEQPIIVYQKLTLPGESTLRTTIQQLAASQETFSDLSIVVLPRLPAQATYSRESEDQT